MILELEEWFFFASYLEYIKTLREVFLNSDIIHVTRIKNLRTDSLTQNVKIQPSFIVHMNVELPIWFTESI